MENELKELQILDSWGKETKALNHRYTVEANAVQFQQGKEKKQKKIIGQ